MDLSIRTRPLAVAQDVDMETGHATPPAKKFVADPSKLVKKKKLRYYCVRRGWVPGIYYTVEEFDAQVEGYGARQRQAFKDAEEAEEYMNHVPEACHFASCTETCQAIAEERPLRDSIAATTTATCELCEETIPISQRLCHQCLQNPEAYLNDIVRRNGLSEEQTAVLKGVAAGASVFITGSTRTGKSVLLRSIVEYFRGLGRIVKAVAYASLPATKIGGQTVSSFARGLAGPKTKYRDEAINDLTSRAEGRSSLYGRPVADVLVLDDIQMIDNFCFTKLSAMVSAANRPFDHRRAQRPFGGAQVILSGDFFMQPPPWPMTHCIYCGRGNQLDAQRTHYTCSEHGIFPCEEMFAFCSPVWQECRLSAVELTASYGPQDSELTRIQQNLRWTGAVKVDDLRLLNISRLNLDEDKQRDATILHPSLNIANKAFRQTLPTLPEDVVKYTARDHFFWLEDDRLEMEKFGVASQGNLQLAHTQYDHHLGKSVQLKLQMLVVLAADVDAGVGLVAGRQGRIVGWEDVAEKGLPQAKEKVADQTLSAGRTLCGELRHYQEMQIRQFRASNSQQNKWPVIEFANGVRQTVYPHCHIRELGHQRPHPLLSRTQLPLLAGSDMSIFRAQHLILDKVVLQLKDCTELGQAYVAFSRVRSLDDLIIESLPGEVKTSKRVQDFMIEIFQGRPAEVGKKVEPCGDEISDVNMADV